MYRKLAIIAYILAVLFAWVSPLLAQAANPYVLVIDIGGTIDALSARYLSRGIDKATDDNAVLVVVRLDTPGGLLSSTRDMVGAILNARVPVAVYVSPPGAQAASAGTFITAAANFAAMAPGTNIGAASPVGASGEDIPTTLAKKINEDTSAFIRSIADARGRSAQAIEETVSIARSFSAREAVESNIVDFMAKDVGDLLRQIDGQTAETVASTTVVSTKDIPIRELKPTVLENILGVLANPNLAFVLFAIGGVGLLAELVMPGHAVSGIVGVIALALAFLGFGNLPVNWIAVGLLAFAFVLFYLETLHPGLSVFGVGGAVCLVLGALLLFGGFFSTPDVPEPSLMVSPWVIGALSAIIVALWVGFIRLVKTEGGASSAYISASKAAIEGEWGVASSDLTPSGKVLVADEEWTATASTTDVIRKGEEVKVLGVYGDILKVGRLYDESEIEDHRK